MKILFNTLVITCLLLVFGCKQEDVTPADTIHFGEVIDETGAKSVSNVLALLEDSEEVETKMVGLVESVCQTKGCWMNLQDVDNPESSSSFFVKFKDYGFFVPKDLSGAKVVVEGSAFKEETSVQELRHYAEDEGLSQEEIDAITEPVEEFKFMASGVKIMK